MDIKKIFSAITMSLAVVAMTSTSVAFASTENINAYFLRKPIQQMSTEERDQITVPPLKVGITRSDAYKFLNTINQKRILDGKEILSMTPDLVIESDFISNNPDKPRSNSKLVDCLILNRGAQTAEDALESIFNNTEYRTMLLDAKYTQVGIGCAYDPYNESQKTTVDEDGVLRTTFVYDTSKPTIITAWAIVLKK